MRAVFVPVILGVVLLQAAIYVSAGVSRGSLLSIDG